MPDLIVTAAFDDNGLKRGLDNVQKELAQTALVAGKLDSALKRSTGGINSAAQSLQNLGRVAQDAPFGFIGIQNNINPLIESFQRLKVETGSTKGALKALVSSLAGAGGIGLAVSVATGVLTILAQKGFFTAAKAADEAGEAMKKFKENVEGAFKEAAKEATGVTALVAVLKNETETRVRKNDALKELQRINPEIFGALKLEEGAVIGLDDAYKAYLANFKTVIAAKILQIQLEDKITKLLKLQGITQSSLAANLINLGRNQAKSQASKGAAGALQGLQKVEKKTANETGLLNVEIDDLTRKLTALSKGIDVRHVKDHIPVTKIKKEVRAVQEEIQKVLTEIKSTTAGGIPALAVPLTVTGPDNAAIDAAMKRLGKRVLDRFPEMTELLKDTFSNLAVTLGETLGNAFSGSGNFLKEALGGVFNIMGDFLIQLGKAAILTSKLFLAIKASKANPISGIIGGIAAIAAGIILKNIQLPAFATGGFVSGPGTSKSDSIHARLSKGEYIMSADTVSRFGKGFFDMINGGGRPRNGGFASGGSVSGGSIGGGAAIEIFGEFELQGTRLVAVVQRAQRRIGRNG